MHFSGINKLIVNILLLNISNTCITFGKVDDPGVFMSTQYMLNLDVKYY